MHSTLSNQASKLHIRNATLADVPAIAGLTTRVYAGTGMHGYSEGEVMGQINNFPKGQFVVLVDEKVVAYCATFRIREDIGLKPHTWAEITGNGYASRHDPAGDWLYGMEVCVDPEYRGYRLGQRLYNERKKLCQSLGLKGVVFSGRLPSLSRRLKKYGSVEKYVEAVQAKQVRDPVLSFQLRNGFEIIGIIPGTWTWTTSPWAMASTWSGAIPRWRRRGKPRTARPMAAACPTPFASVPCSTCSGACVPSRNSWRWWPTSWTWWPTTRGISSSSRSCSPCSCCPSRTSSSRRPNPSRP
jgi:ribosomal protein S18 acetylase RimI-like enzyme